MPANDTVNINENLVIAKKSVLGFFVTEFFVYLSQIFMFFVVAALSSKMLSSETILVEYVNSKISEHSIWEVFYVVLGSIFIVGFIYIIMRLFEQKLFLENLADEVLAEIPRAIYLFGSSSVGGLIASAIFIQIHPDSSANASKLYFLAGAFGLAVFLYGAGLSYILKRKTHIKSNNPVEPVSLNKP